MFWLTPFFVGSLVRLPASHAFPLTERAQSSTSSWEDLANGAFSLQKSAVNPSEFTKLETLRVGSHLNLAALSRPDNAFLDSLDAATNIQYWASTQPPNLNSTSIRKPPEGYLSSLRRWTFPSDLEGSTYQKAQAAIKNKFPAQTYQQVEVFLAPLDPFQAGNAAQEVFWLFQPAIGGQLIRDVWQPSTGKVDRFRLSQLGLSLDPSTSAHHDQSVGSSSSMGEGSVSSSSTSLTEGSSVSSSSSSSVSISVQKGR